MLQMILYSITIMYTPGRVTITSANIGLNKSYKKGLPFFIGASIAMFALYIIMGYFGSIVIPDNIMMPVSLIGGLYMLHLAYKIFKSNIELSNSSNTDIGFREGFIMQFFNPKAIIAVLPVISIYFPMLGIDGIKILYMALFFTILVFGSPSLYALIGQFFSSVFNNKKIISIFNKIMALVLAYIAVSALYHYVFLQFYGS